MKCPICKVEFAEKPFKEWQYGKFRVSRFECPDCREKFNSYVSDDSKSFTIPGAD